MFHFLTDAAANAGDAATNGAAGGGLFSLLFPLLMFGAIFYFMLIRPEKKRKKEEEQKRNDLKNGDRITTIGGICGVVVDIKENKFVIETGADRVRIEFAKWALSTNETGAERAKEEAKKAEAAKAKAKAEKKAKLDK